VEKRVHDVFSSRNAGAAQKTKCATPIAMRILVISGGYPPFRRDSAALGCQEIVESLKQRGHQIQILTSAPRLVKSQRDTDIHRWLIRDRKELMSWQKVVLKEVVNQTSFKMLCRDFQPDIVFLFDLSQISVSFVPLAQEMGLPVCGHVSNDWLATWEADRWYREQPKGERGYNVLRFLIRHFKLKTFLQPLRLSHVIFVSRYLETAAASVGKSATQAAVIPWGIDIGRFSYHEADGQKPSRLLYVGPIKPQKGIDIAIRALGILKHRYGGDHLSMTVAGDQAAFPDYLTYLRDLADSMGVQKNMAFVDYAPDRTFPDLYHTHDIFILPSVIAESLTRPILEAMSCGLGIVSTATGGNSEILKDEFNALVIPKENPDLCARQIQRLLEDPQLFEFLRVRARRTIEEKCRLEQSVNSIEDVLKDAGGQAMARRRQAVFNGYRLTPERDRLRSLAKLADLVKRWLAWSSPLVQARGLAKPKPVKDKLQDKILATSSHLALLVFPLLYEGYFLLSGRRRKNLPRTDSPPREVLVVQLADLGDIVLTGPFLRELRRFLPQAKIVLVVQPSMFNVVEKCPYIDDLRLFKWRTIKDYQKALQGLMRWWPKAFWLTMQRLSKYHFEMAISPRWNDDACQAASLILMRSSGAPQRVAYIDALNSSKLFRTNNVNRLITQGPARVAPKHEIEYQLDVLNFLGAHPEDTKLEVWTTPEDDRFAQNVLNQHGVTGKDLLIAFAPGAKWAYRRWPASRFQELGRWLQENYQAHILILAEKAERKLALDIARGLEEKRTINLAGKTTLREMASVLKSCKFFVGNDSGPMHIAVAAGATAVGLFGPGEYERFKPWGPDHEVIRIGLSCSPCSEYCKFSEALCIKGITVNQVQNVLSEKLRAMTQDVTVTRSIAGHSPLD
jgi:ADP-heptose:LPS heptosyltransferase/glycosyltransferase involved in cell wall biosynthesis